MMNIKITAYPHSWCAYAIGPYIFSKFKAVAVLLIGIFLSANPPPILISSRMPWCSHQLMNGVWQELTTPPLPFPNVYIVNKLPRQLPTILQYAWSKIDIKIPFTHIPKVKYTLSGVMDCISCHTFVYIQISTKGKRVTYTYRWGQNK